MYFTPKNIKYNSWHILHLTYCEEFLSLCVRKDPTIVNGLKALSFCMFQFSVIKETYRFSIADAQVVKVTKYMQS